MVNDFQGNKLLSTLSRKEYHNLSDFLEPVGLSPGEVLLESNRKPKFVYFPLQGIVSLTLQMNNGSTTEVGSIGCEGMVGTLQFLGQGVCQSRSIVKVEGRAMRIEVSALQVEFDCGQRLQKLLLQYALQLYNQVSQIAACNNRHTVKQRTACSLLMLDDRYGREKIPMTHQLLSQILGVRRTGITLAAKQIQQQGIIDYRRGKIEILDREALEEVACECYQVLRI